jgi:hypothetical protein
MMHAQVSGLRQLHKLSLPFPITSSHLQRLSKLPQLVELLSFEAMEMDVLGPAHDPQASVTKLVTSNIDSHGKPLAALLPALQSVYLRSCGDMEALSLRSVGAGLGVLVAGDCSSLTDEGFAGLRVLRGLTRLQIDSAHQVGTTRTCRRLGTWFVACCGPAVPVCSPSSGALACIQTTAYQQPSHKDSST